MFCSVLIKVNIHKMNKYELNVELSLRVSITIVNDTRDVTQFFNVHYNHPLFSFLHVL